MMTIVSNTKRLLTILLNSTCAVAILLSALSTPAFAGIDDDSDDESFDVKPYTVPLGSFSSQTSSVQNKEEKVASSKLPKVRDNKATNSQANFGEIPNFHLLENITPSLLISLPETEINGIFEKMNKATLIVFSDKMDEEKSRLAADKKKKKEVKALGVIQVKLDQMIIDRLCEELGLKYYNLLSEDEILNFRSKVVDVVKSKQCKQKPSDPSISVAEVWRLDLIEKHYSEKYKK